MIYNSIRVGLSERSWGLASLRVMGFNHRKAFAIWGWECLLSLTVALLPGFWGGYFLLRFNLGSVHTESFSFPVNIDPNTYGWAMLILLTSFGFSLLIMYRIVKPLRIVEALKARG